MTLRDAMLTLFKVGSVLVAADSCAASPLPNSRGGLRDRAAGYEVTVLLDGASAPTFTHDGETYVLGQLGARYTLRVTNHEGRRIEAVVSVDGRDVVDGKPADFRGKRGYLVPARGSIDIDGWRISQAEAAAFRFSSVPDSYAARTGNAREVGVVGVAIFPERVVPAPFVYEPRPPLVPGQSPPASDLRAHDQMLEGIGKGGDGAGIADMAPSAPAKSEAAAPRDRALPSANEAQATGPLAKKSRSQAPAPQARPGLGTEYGEALSSPIYEVEFTRANANHPTALLGVRYNDRDGLLAMGIPVDDAMTCASESDLRRSADPFPATDRRFAAPPAGWRRVCEWR